MTKITVLLPLDMTVYLLVGSFAFGCVMTYAYMELDWLVAICGSLLGAFVASAAVNYPKHIEVRDENQVQ